MIEGRRVDGAAAFRGRYRRALSPQFFPSDVTIPTAGCWLLRLRVDGRGGVIVLRALPPA